MNSRIDEPAIVFVTACTKDRKPWCATKEVENALVQTWRRATFWCVGRYVIMPDHVHFFASATDESGDLETWMRYWKRLFQQDRKHPDERWQSGHWDTRIRDATHFADKCDYILNNPVRKGLVSKPDEWPFQGEVFELRWR